MKNPISYINHSLSLKLCIGILAVVTTVFIISIGYLFERSRQIVRLEARQRVTHMLENTSLRVKKHIREVKTATENISWLVEDNLRPDSLYNYTRRVVEQNPNINGCSITLEPGVLPQWGRNFSVYTIREGDQIETAYEEDYNYYEKVWYKTPHDKKQACWTDPYSDYNEGTLSSPFMIASYGRPLYSEAGGFIGVISTDLSIQWLSNAISAEKPYPNSYCFMLGSDGHYFVHPNRMKLVKQTIFTAYDPKEYPEIAKLGKEMTAGKTGHQRIRYKGKTYAVFYQPVEGTDWSIALVCMENDVFSAYNMLSFVIVPLILIGLLLTFLVCWKTVKHFIKPLDELAQQSHSIAEGNFDVNISRSNRKDDVGDLQNTFVTMLESISENVNSIQKMNEETERSNEELAKANQLAQEAEERKAESLREASHQIRTPLNIIGGFMQVVSDNQEMLSPEEVRESTDAMKQYAITIRRMSNMLYDVSRLEYVPLDLSQEVEVNEVIDKSIQNFEELQPYDAVLNYTSKIPNPHYIHSNRLYLHRSLRELLINAKKFASEKPIDFTVEATEEGMLRFTIEDHGKGIPEEERERIYQPYYKIDPFGEGFGIGLGLTQQHVKDMKGILLLDPEYTEGARFVVEIPNA